MTSKTENPPGKTFFDQLGDRSFANLKIDNSGIPTLDFLNAASGLAELFGMMLNYLLLFIGYESTANAISRAHWWRSIYTRSK